MSAAWEKYLPAVEAMRPGCGDDEKRHRAGMMLLRDQAAAGLSRACPDARSVLMTIVGAASVHCTALAPERVKDCHAALVKLMQAARAVEGAFGAEWRLQHEA